MSHRPTGSTYSAETLLREGQALAVRARASAEILRETREDVVRLEHAVRVLGRVHSALLDARTRATDAARRKEALARQAQRWISGFRILHDVRLKRAAPALPPRPPRNSRNAPLLARHIDALMLHAPDLGSLPAAFQRGSALAASLRAAFDEHTGERRSRVPRLVSAERRAKREVHLAMASVARLASLARPTGPSLNLKGLRPRR